MPQVPVPNSGNHNVVKVDFHLHSGEDPLDEIEHTALTLLHHAHNLGYDAIAITLHDHVLTQPELFQKARELGVLMVPSVEIRLEGADVVVLNLSEEEAQQLVTLHDLHALRQRRGRSVLIFAPHPYYILGGSMGQRLEQYIDCFDAIEMSHFHTKWLNLNRFAVKIAHHYKKPLLATSDAHRLDFFGEHYSLVATCENPSIEDIFDGIRDGRVELVSPAWPTWKFFHYLLYILVIHPFQCLGRKLQE
jgi:predicted metal-dependent phosphoesterase TrpH